MHLDAWPQVGDEVVYIREGHDAYFAAVLDKAAMPPAALLAERGIALRPAEPCTVVRAGSCAVLGLIDGFQLNI